MKLPKIKHIDWNKKRRRFQIKYRIKHRFIRFKQWVTIRKFILKTKNDVIKTISLGYNYKKSIYGYDKYQLYAYKFIAMRYGLNFHQKYWVGKDVGYGYIVILSAKS